ncbi:MAG: hypothetical protein ABL866_01315 [Devosia sp.]
MVSLIHEVWIDPTEDGQTHQSLLLAGPDGDGARKLMGPNCQQVTTFSADSHFEAMTIYYRIWEWGTYATDHDWDYEPYPESWAQRQKTNRRDA